MLIEHFFSNEAVLEFGMSVRPSVCTFVSFVFFPSVSTNLKNNKCIKSILFIADLKLKQKSLSNVGYAIKQHWNLVVRAELFGFL